MITLRKSGAPVEQAVFLRKGGALVEQEVWLRKGGVLQLVHSPGGPIDVDVPPSVYGAGARNSTISVTTEQATATITGGQAPYTYLWQRTDAPLGAWTIVTPAAASSAFRCAGVGPGDSIVAEFALTVTDARGTVATSADVVATAENYGSLGGEPIP